MYNLLGMTDMFHPELGKNILYYWGILSLKEIADLKFFFFLFCGWTMK